MVISTKYSQIYNTKQRSGHIYQVLSDIQHKTEIWSYLPRTLRYTTQTRDLVISTKYSQIYNTKLKSGHIHQVLLDIQKITDLVISTRSFQERNTMFIVADAKGRIYHYFVYYIRFLHYLSNEQ